MSIKDEYIRQAGIRDWARYFEKLPLDNESVVFDLGCGIGAVSRMLGQKYSKVIAFDKNAELIKEAKRTFAAENVHFLSADLRAIDHVNLPRADGIWCSFTAAYFPDLEALLSGWTNLLKPGGWIALVEANDMFNHVPLTKDAQDAFSDLAQRLLQTQQYDVMMGSKLGFYAEKLQLKIFAECEMSDAELAFAGPATNQVLSLWNARLDRIRAFKHVLGKSRFEKVKDEFLSCLHSNDHTCFTKVNFIIAVKEG